MEKHPLLDAVLDTGDAALPVRSLSGFVRFVRQMRGGQFDLAVSLVRSPLMSAAVLLSGIRSRAGLNSAGRGFGYNIRAPVDPAARRHEAEIYLDVARALGIDVSGLRPNIPVREDDRAAVRTKLRAQGLLDESPYLVVNPAGGRNPGMIMDAKRYPLPQMAELARRAAGRVGAVVVVIGGPQDGDLVHAVDQALGGAAARFVGGLTFGEIGALAAEALLYLGNDTGLTHLAAASGARTAMILGPSDPARYAPYSDQAIALWKPAKVSAAGVAAGAPRDWDWTRDGISVDEAEMELIAFLERTSSK